jgi:hypothetical protein
MNCTGDIEFCVMCENPDTRLEPDDFDFCKKCQIAELQKQLEQEKKLGLYLFKKFVPESEREQIARAAFLSLK